MVSLKKKTVAITALLLIASLVIGAAIADDTDTETDIENSAPTVDSVSTPESIDPGVKSQEFSATISDDNGLDDIDSITITLYRSDVDKGDSDSERKHYTITWNVGEDAAISPSGSVNKTSSLDTDVTQDTVSFEWTPVEYAAPSDGTTNDTVNGYDWVMDVEVDDGDSTDTKTGTTDINRKIAMSLDTESISSSPVAGETAQYSPDIELSNNGNVWLQLNYEATNQTNATTSDEIPASSMYLDDDSTHDESEETDLSEQNYDTTTKTWTEMDLEYNNQLTLSNFVEVPSNIDAAKYSGTITYSAEESHAE